MYEYQVPYLPTVLDDLTCTGEETSLLDCCHIRGRHKCSSTIGIECTGSFLLRNHLESVDSICSDDTNMPISPRSLAMICLEQLFNLRVYVGMAPTRPLSLNKHNRSKHSNVALFRHRTCSTGVSIHCKTLKVGKIH